MFQKKKPDGPSNQHKWALGLKQKWALSFCSFDHFRSPAADGVCCAWLRDAVRWPTDEEVWQLWRRGVLLRLSPEFALEVSQGRVRETRRANASC